MHRAKVFLTVCAGLLCLALAYHFGANSVGAQTGVAPEVAVLSGVVSDGGTIPLPHYQDGTEALESECHWTVSPQTLLLNGPGAPEFERCSTVGRTVRVYWCHSGCSPMADCVPSPCGFPTYPGTANYFIVAVRSSVPTPAQRESFGGLKARMRGERGAGEPGQDR